MWGLRADRPGLDCQRRIPGSALGNRGAGVSAGKKPRGSRRLVGRPWLLGDSGLRAVQPTQPARRPQIQTPPRPFFSARAPSAPSASSPNPSPAPRGRVINTAPWQGRAHSQLAAGQVAAAQERAWRAAPRGTGGPAPPPRGPSGPSAPGRGSAGGRPAARFPRSDRRRDLGPGGRS